MELDERYKKDRKNLLKAIKNDPCDFLNNYSGIKDIEIAGFLAAQFAYGKIDVFKRFLKNLFEKMGGSPYDFIKKGDFTELKGMYYRFQKEKDLIRLFEILKSIIDEFGSIGAMFKHFYRGDIREALWSARRYLFGEVSELTFFFPNESKSNPMKRWNLFLRWMVRKDEIDKGLWDFIDKKDLIIPLDTHIFKIGRCLGWTKTRSASYKAACDITEALRRFSPEDPLKYDFFLCHRVGIAAGCRGVKSQSCADKCLIFR